MAINFKLGAVRQINRDGDPMDRDWVGYSPTHPANVTFEQNRGIWKLKLSRAKHERYATFSYDGHIKLVARIKRIDALRPPSPGSPNKKIVVGELLHPGDPVYEHFIDRQVDAFRNPVSYIEDPDSGQAPQPQHCACGCGAEVSGDRNFIPGHDQRAVHERIARQWGDTLGFIRWFDATYPNAD